VRQEKQQEDTQPIAWVLPQRKEFAVSSVQRLQHTSVPMPPGGEETARQFYGTTLGLREIPTPQNLAAMKLLWFAVAADGGEVHLFTDEEAGSNAAQHLCLEVDDLAAYERRLIDEGYRVEIPEAIVNRPRLFTRDPFGNRIELVQILGPYH
jgi:catechol 2,3-dioxygenase-like lactoylglutathione lyase family enzyme